MSNQPISANPYEVTDEQLAIDYVFRAAHGAQRNPHVAAIVLQKYVMDLEARGWKWQPEEFPSVVKENIMLNQEREIIDLTIT